MFGRRGTYMQILARKKEDAMGKKKNPWQVFTKRVNHYIVEKKSLIGGQEKRGEGEKGQKTRSCKKKGRGKQNIEVGWEGY